MVQYVNVHQLSNCQDILKAYFNNYTIVFIFAKLINYTCHLRCTRKLFEYLSVTKEQKLLPTIKMMKNIIFLII